MIRWTKTRFEDEITEFKRVVIEFVGDDDKDSLNYLKSEYAKSRITDLQDNVWKILQNSGSWEVNSFNDLFKNMKKDNVKRDVSRIMTQFIGKGVVNDWSGRVECPIILLAPGNKPYHYNLIAGNTRLTAARALGIRPKVVIVRTDW